MNREELAQALTEQQAEMERHLGAPEPELELRHGPGKWTVRQLLTHLADCEFINLHRFCKAVVEPGCSVESFDQERFAEVLRSEARHAGSLRALFVGARCTLIEHVRELPEAQLANASVHPEKGTMSGWAWAELTLGHGAHHLSQVVAAREGRPWTKPAIERSHLFGA